MDHDKSLRRLVLMRHAKSDWSTPGEPDHARRLNLRGRLAAPLMGAWLAEQPWRIDLALVSDAARTQETWARLAPLLPAAPTVALDGALYLAEPETMREALAAAPADATTVLMLGHNPGVERFGTALGATSGPRSGAFPTAAIGVFTMRAASWSEARFGGFQLDAYEEPKGLV